MKSSHLMFSKQLTEYQGRSEAGVGVEVVPRFDVEQSRSSLGGIATVLKQLCYSGGRNSLS